MSSPYVPTDRRQTRELHTIALYMCCCATLMIWWQFSFRMHWKRCEDTHTQRCPGIQMLVALAYQPCYLGSFVSFTKPNHTVWTTAAGPTVRPSIHQHEMQNDAERHATKLSWIFSHFSSPISSIHTEKTQSSYAHERCQIRCNCHVFFLSSTSRSTMTKTAIDVRSFEQRESLVQENAATRPVRRKGTTEKMKNEGEKTNQQCGIAWKMYVCRCSV